MTACLLVVVSQMNCNRSDPPLGGGGEVSTNGGSIGGEGGNSAGGGILSLSFGGAAGNGFGGSGPGTDDAAVAVWPPPGFVNVTDSTFGAYALGPNLSADADAGAAGGSSGTPTPPSQCAGLFGVVRDFKLGNQAGGHPDFETAPVGDDLAIVAGTLGPDGKPVYANATGITKSTTGKANFDQWYNDVPDVNIPFVLGLHIVDVNGLATFSAIKPNYFFPLDDQGFGNQGQPHNFAFTTEIHTAFTYKGGEVFQFCGDDDVFVFINNQLVINMGGRHAQECKNPNPTIDAMGLTVGRDYEIAIFHAERHSDASNFQIQTTLAFSNCGYVEGIIY
jgi:fibro-slime domain-containing protein